MDQHWSAAPRTEAIKVRLRDVLKPRRTTIEYLYDFGDSWEHRLIVTKIRPGEPGTSYPRYIGGEWGCPPEDCGCIPGYYNMLDALADEKPPDHAEVAASLEDWDPKEIEEPPLRIALGRIANRRNAARKRIAKTAASLQPRDGGLDEGATPAWKQPGPRETGAGSGPAIGRGPE
jgi:hypothetical protein